ncbi:MAG: hypothetical protein QOH43_2889, partial [Solirubrobacteraceae bacterium]|nr:hypothetical protein [Solirubrobacteraceae bacterium]
LGLFVGQLRLDSGQTFFAHAPFSGLFFTYLWRSPSFVLGLVLLVPLIILLGERLRAGRVRGANGEWALAVLFMVGASDAKITILPLLLVGLGLYAASMGLARRRIPVAVWPAAGLVLLVMAAVYAMQYRGHSSRLGVDPFSAFDGMTAVSLLKRDLSDALPGFPGKASVLSTAGVLFGCVGMLSAQLVGLLWLLRRRGRKLEDHHVWLASLAVAGLLVACALGEPGTQNQLYFLFYGLVAGLLLAGEGLWLAWLARPRFVAGDAARIALLAGAWVAFVVVLMVVPRQFDFAGSMAESHVYVFWYGGMFIGLGVLYWAARALLGPRRWAAAALASGALVFVGALDTPIDSLYGVTRGQAGSLPGASLSPDLYEALSWIRDKTPTDAVLAVNNQWYLPGERAPLAFNYAAFGERRVFLEGWAYSQRTYETSYAKVAGGFNPFADRLRLNRAAFMRGDVDAIRAMKRHYGVRFLLIDRAIGYHADLPALVRVARIVYRNPAAVVLELR